jgi:hypothetical protein
MMSQDEQMLTDSFPGLSRDAIREAAIKRGYAVADLGGDVKLSMMVAGVDLKDKVVTMDGRKLALLEQAAERARKTEEVLDSKLSSTDQAQRIREIFKK